MKKLKKTEKELHDLYLNANAVIELEKKKGEDTVSAKLVGDKVTMMSLIAKLFELLLNSNTIEKEELIDALEFVSLKLKGKANNESK